ncbi:uncharacterized protein LOC112085240 [Eutrema salsugineum]|uniref:uncharacterized protein LOC112085240 n=1 Tax=Eutrema salsugineum TaxID=72664 RepID=UPI000CED5D1E|nr:uncharacterized protein LOC112085240 [Eutrema salsugineum]
MTDDYGAMIKTNGALTRHKARLVANGKSQEACFDFTETFSLVVKGADLAYILLYIDDIVLAASSPKVLGLIIESLKTEFPMTDLGKIHHFLGMKASYNEQGPLLSQATYLSEILTRAGMQACKSCATPVDLKSKLSVNSGEPVTDATEYKSLAGALHFLTFTRTDISYAIHQVCLYMHDPKKPLVQALKRIIRYIKSTLHHRIQLVKGSLTSFTVYSDADWTGFLDTRRSTSGYYVFLGQNIISWSVKRQQTVSRSSSEAECKGVENTVAELCWIRNLMLELHFPHQGVCCLP